MNREKDGNKRRFEEDEDSRDAQPPKKKRRTNKTPKSSQSKSRRSRKPQRSPYWVEDSDVKATEEEETLPTATTTTPTTTDPTAPTTTGATVMTQTPVVEKKSARKSQRHSTVKKLRYKRKKPTTTDVSQRRYDSRGLEIFPEVLRRPIVVDPPPGVKVQYQYDIGDKVLVWYGKHMQYEAAILGRNADWNPAKDNFDYDYKVHYLGWKASWDMWKPVTEIEPFSEEAKKAAAENRRERTKLVKGRKRRSVVVDASSSSEQSDSHEGKQTDESTPSTEKKEESEQSEDKQESPKINLRKMQERIRENCRLINEMSRMVPLPVEKGFRVVDVCESFLKSKHVTNRNDSDRRQYYQLIQNMLSLFDRVAFKRCLCESEWDYVSKTSEKSGLEAKRLLGMEHFARFLCEFGSILERGQIHPGMYHNVMKKANTFASYIDKNINKFWPPMRPYEDLEELMKGLQEN